MLWQEQGDSGTGSTGIGERSSYRPRAVTHQLSRRENREVLPSKASRKRQGWGLHPKTPRLSVINESSKAFARLGEGVKPLSPHAEPPEFPQSNLGNSINSSSRDFHPDGERKGRAADKALSKPAAHTELLTDTCPTTSCISPKRTFALLQAAPAQQLGKCTDH